ncbi:hypothetical protein D9613_005053 [Agrocybe pediades]|uniref:Protein-serine/threonine kinase n=1 Tax=Agrocybe pediades TaxID=84607 RepID=A0A8H4VRZ1_9AGAR|nr:hypothetical protein D9613_005053 [Agrocybe pediades]
MLKYGNHGRLRLLRANTSVRHESTALHFYQNRQLELYASKEAKRLTLRQLVYFGRHMNEERLLTSANYVRTELPVRIAHRLRDLQALPYVVVTQEGVDKVYELYWSAFEKFRRYPPVTTLAENEKFCDFLRTLLDEHAPVIPNLSLGLSLSSPYLPPDKLDSFMRRMLISRISRRVLAEHHIALSETFSGRGKTTEGEPHVGIIFTGLNVKQSIEHCATLLNESPLWATESLGSGGYSKRANVLIDGHLDTNFAYIREHLEYIVFELLKNSMRTTYNKHAGESILPPIQVTIASGQHDVGIRISDQGGGLHDARNQVVDPSDLFSFSHVRNATRLEDERLGALRSASSSEHGLKATVDEQIGSWEKTLSKESWKIAEQNFQSRIGIGLPMSNIYATYFGGKLELVSLDGWGTDVHVRLPKLGTNLEGIEV